MTLPRLGLAMVWFLAVSACRPMTGPGEEDRLQAARRLWAADGLHDYSYEVRSDCFCRQAGRWIQVRVVGDRVVGGLYLDTSTPVEQGFVGALPSVNDLFTRVADAVGAHAVLLQVEYDARDGHPTRINVDVSHRIADEEYMLQNRNLLHLISGLASPR